MDILYASGYREFYRLALQHAHEVIAHEVMQDILDTLQATKDWDFYRLYLEHACVAILRFDANWGDDSLTLRGSPRRAPFVF